MIPGNKIARVSASTLDNFLYWQASSEDSHGGITEDELVERIITPYSEDGDNFKQQRGIDFHNMMAEGLFAKPKLAWDRASIDAHLTDADRLGIHEVWISADLFGLFVPAKADLLNGLELTDWKCTSSGFDAEKLQASIQWKLYLLLTDCETFRYRVFEVSDSQPIKVFRDHTLTMARYPEMERDVENVIRDYLTWANTKPAIVEAYSSRKLMAA